MTSELKPAILKVYNRKQARTAAAIGMKHERVVGVPATNESKKEFKTYRKELAVAHGSKTGKLKKKHIEKERRLQALINLDLENN